MVSLFVPNLDLQVNGVLKDMCSVINSRNRRRLICTFKVCDLLIAASLNCRLSALHSGLVHRCSMDVHQRHKACPENVTTELAYFTWIFLIE